MYLLLFFILFFYSSIFYTQWNVLVFSVIIWWALTNEHTHTPYSYQYIKYWHHPRKFLRAPSQSASMPRRNYCCDLFHYRFILWAPNAHTQCILMCFASFLRRNVFETHSCYCMSVFSSVLLLSSIVWANLNWSIHSPVGRNSGWF